MERSLKEVVALRKGKLEEVLVESVREYLSAIFLIIRKPSSYAESSTLNCGDEKAAVHGIKWFSLEWPLNSDYGCLNFVRYDFYEFLF